METGVELTTTQANPLVSVLIPCYNHEKYIAECLESILEDGYQNIEIIIINDGSSDSSSSKCSLWIKENCHRVKGGVSLYDQENKGLIKTLNLLVTKAVGEYFVLIAGDDMLLPNGIQSRLNYLKLNRDMLAVFGDASGVDGNGGLLFKSVIQEKFKADVDTLLSRRFASYEIILNWCVPGPVFMADRKAIELVGLYSEEFRIEDRDYYLRLLAADKLGFIDKTVAVYRLHSAALTATRQRQRIIGEIVADIDKKRFGLFKGMRAAAVYLSWRANATRLSGKKFPKREFLLIDVIIAKIVTKIFLFVCRSWARSEKMKR